MRIRDVIYAVPLPIQAFCAAALGSTLVLTASRYTSTPPEPPPTVIAVNLQRILATHVADVGKRVQTLDEATIQREATAYATALNASLDELGDAHTVILNSNVVIHGAPDLTEQLQARVAAKLATGSAP